MDDLPEDDAKPERLEAAWRRTAELVPEGWELAGVTYHGPAHSGPWIAFLYSLSHRDARGPEGVGPTAIAALESLREALADSGPTDW
jgi:hypothetical protein